MASRSSTIETFDIIIHTEVTRLSGSWNLRDIPDASLLRSASDTSYDYLIHVDHTNHRVHPDDLHHLKTMKDAFQAHKDCAFCCRLINPKGEMMELRGMGRLREDAHDSLPAVDLASEPAPILRSINLLEAVFNTSSLGLHVLQSIRNDQGAIVDFDVILANKASDKIAGRKVTGMRMLEGWPHTKDIGLFDKFVSAVETGEMIHHEQPYEGDGVRAWFEWIGLKFGDGLYVTIEDITVRKKNEQALKSTADKLQSTFDGVPAIIALLEAVRDENGEPVDFIVSAANKAMADFTGDQTDSIIGRRMTELYPDAFQGQLLENHFRVFKTGQPLQVEFLYPGLDRWFSLFLTRQVDGKGIVAVAIEITEQKKGEEQKKQNQILRELNEAKTRFFANVSHEFRTPLSLILAPLGDLLNTWRATSNSDDLRKLEIINRNALRLEKLVNTILHFSRIEAGKEDAVFKPTDLAELTTLLAGNFRSVIESAGLVFVVDCESTEPIYVNHDMWEKIVLNLISNAFKFTFHGTIEVSLRSYKRHVKLRVRDSGIGIASSNHALIFERFTRISGARSRSYEGTGIGLALVKELVHIHRGSIAVTSKEGEGSLFTVTILKGKSHLPVKSIYESKDKSIRSLLGSIYADETANWIPGEADIMKVVDDRATQSLSGQKAIVLVVDDNADIREYIRSILSKQYLVATAHNGEQALDLIAAGLTPDLVLTDLMMAEMDGFTLVGRLHQTEQTRQTPVIMLSARASEDDRLEGFRYGVSDYLVKPFSSRELLALVHSRLRKDRAPDASQGGAQQLA